LSQRLAKLEALINELQAGTKLEARTSNSTRTAALAEEAYDDEDEEQNIRRLDELEERLRALETSGDTAKLHPPKTALEADSAEPQKSANQAQKEGGSERRTRARRRHVQQLPPRP
jgi:hypothetical protein